MSPINLNAQNPQVDRIHFIGLDKTAEEPLEQSESSSQNLKSPAKPSARQPLELRPLPARPKPKPLRMMNVKPVAQQKQPNNLPNQPLQPKPLRPLPSLPTLLMKVCETYPNPFEEPDKLNITKEEELRLHDAFRAVLKEMDYKVFEIQLVLKDLCSTIEAFKVDVKNERRFRKNEVTYPGIGTRFVFTFHLRKLLNGYIYLTFTTPSQFVGALAGQGEYKIVKKAIQIEFSAFKPQMKFDVQVKDVVLIRAKNGMELYVQDCFDLLRELHQKLGKEVLLPQTPVERRYYSKNGFERYELVQEWYNGDLWRAIVKKEVPLNIDKSEKISFDTVEKLDALLQVTDTLEKFHAAGYVHMDVKPANILLKVDQKLNLKALISDFDLTSSLRVCGRRAKYCYWDPLAREGGILTYNSDVYGLAYTLGQALFPDFLSIVGTPFYMDVDLFFSKVMEKKMSLFFKRLKLDGHPISQPFFEIIKGPLNYFRVLNREILLLLNQLCSSDELSETQKDLIRRFRVEISFLPQIWTLITETINVSAKVYEEIMENSSLLGKLDSVKDEDVKAGIKAVMEILDTQGLLTAGQFKELLKSIRNSIAQNLNTLSPSLYSVV